MRHLPKSLCHLGHVEAAALLVDSSVLGLAETRRRILSLWRPGADVFDVEPGIFVIRAVSPGRVDTQACPGAPLTWEAGALWALPLSPDERQCVDAPAGSVVFARAGELVVKPLSSAARVDLSEWLDVSALEVARVKSLSAPARAPAVPPPPADVRTALGGDIPPPAPEQEVLLATLTTPGAAPSAAHHSSRHELWPRLMSWLAWRTAALLQSLGAARAPASKALPAPQKPRPPGLFSRLAARLERWAATLANLSGLSKILEQQHARYLGHLLDLFEDGDLTEALRYAVPLSTGRTSGNSRIMWRPPKPRDELRISPQQGTSGASLGVGVDLFAHLAWLYRSAVTRLERQGRISEAAFVLAELLQDTEEAISFLERHGKLREAAELAEGRDVEPGLLVRQWFVAGDRLRALAAARRTGAYADAMARLEREKSEWAYALRMSWADTLARAGDYGAALELMWALPELRERSRELIDKAIALGGATAARALVRKVALDPDSFEVVLPSALELLEDDEPERASERLAFASELALATPPAPAAAKAQVIPLRADAPRIPPVREDTAAPLRTLARPALRALVRDGRESPAEIRWELDRLSRAAGEPALVADLPRLSEPGAAPPAAHFAPELRIGAGDAGTRPVLDAIRLPSRRFLLALGEAGARIVTADGRLVHHFDVPAHQLAVSENGARAIAIAPRGSVHRLSRIDLAEGTARFWCEAKLELWARTYNGERWYAAERDSVFVIDALAEDFKALWHIGDLGGRVLSMAHSAERWCFATASEVWTIETPTLTLRSRATLKIPPLALQMMRVSLAEPRSVIALDPSGRCAFVHAAIDLEPPLPIEPKVPEQLYPSVAVYFGGEAPLISPGMGPSGRPVLSGGFLVVPAGPQLLLFDEGRRAAVSRVVLERGHWTSVRIDGSALVAADDCGRVVHLDVSKAHVVRALRV